eukprot:3926481-Amphidinium_carterae.1
MLSTATRCRAKRRMCVCVQLALSAHLHQTSWLHCFHWRHQPELPDFMRLGQYVHNLAENGSENHEAEFLYRSCSVSSECQDDVMSSESIQPIDARDSVTVMTEQKSTAIRKHNVVCNMQHRCAPLVLPFENDKLCSSPRGDCIAAMLRTVQTASE